MIKGPRRQSGRQRLEENRLPPGGEEAGSKLADATTHGVAIIDEAEFRGMLG
jgi:hypothetical protein